MVKVATPKFQNDQGVSDIYIGTKELECTGASQPHDHPHIYLDMGKDSNIVCPYCSTVYHYNDKLAANETKPKGCLVKA